MKKKTWYLIRTASDRMGGNDSYRGVDEEELLSQDKDFFKCPYYSFYKLMDKNDLIALKNNKKKKKKGAYTIAITCSGGTAIAGTYKAKSEEEAIKVAKAEHGDQWTYCVWENPDK